jgi:hypothetical protein
MGRLAAMDDAAASDAGLQLPSRATYCCDGRYGLPGGSRTLTLEIEDIWPHASAVFGFLVSPLVCSVLWHQHPALDVH